jgi:hypothetical protein
VDGKLQAPYHSDRDHGRSPEGVTQFFSDRLKGNVFFKNLLKRNARQPCESPRDFRGLPSVEREETTQEFRTKTIWFPTEEEEEKKAVNEVAVEEDAHFVAFVLLRSI